MYCFPKNVKNEHIFLTLHFYGKFKFEENKQSRTLQKFWIGRWTSNQISWNWRAQYVYLGSSHKLGRMKEIFLKRFLPLPFSESKIFREAYLNDERLGSDRSTSRHLVLFDHDTVFVSMKNKELRILCVNKRTLVTDNQHLQFLTLIKIRLLLLTHAMKRQFL